MLKCAICAKEIKTGREIQMNGSKRKITTCATCNKDIKGLLDLFNKCTDKNVEKAYERLSKIEDNMNVKNNEFKNDVMEFLEEECREKNYIMYRRVWNYGNKVVEQTKIKEREAEIKKIREREVEIKKLEEQRKEEQKRRLYLEEIKKILLTTSYNFEGFKIVKYHDIVSANTVLGTGAMSEFTANISDFFGVTSSAFEKKMDTAKRNAQNKLRYAAYDTYRANAVIGVDFDYMTLGNNMIAVSANGTAVTIEKCKNY